MLNKWIKALDFLYRNERRHLELQMKIAEIPAPYGREKDRGRYISELLKSYQLEVNFDHVGNVVSILPGSSGSLIVVAAHLDSAFTESTEFKVTKSGNKIFGPSIVDNSLGLMSMLAIIESLRYAEINTHCSLMFVATVGEEGLGDLRGVKAIFENKSFREKIAGFIALDSHGHEKIINQSLGCKRYKIDIKGPGGHSYLDYGNPNPLCALAKFIQNINDIKIPEFPKSTLNIGVVRSGTSVNVIPKVAEVEIDIRSVDPSKLSDLEGNLYAAIEEGVASVNSTVSNSDDFLRCSTVVIGNRPCGFTSIDNPLVKGAKEAGLTLGLETSYGVGSSDANVPMSYEIPAIKIGAGGQGGGLHTEQEWFDCTDAYLGRQRALLTILNFDHARSCYEKT